MFDRFWQGDSSTTRVHGGLGLGLAVVRHIAEMHGGKVGVESAGLGKGSAFTVELPLGMVPVEQGEATERDDDLSELLTLLKNARVLVVDDQVDSSDMIVSLLSAAGAVVATAPSVTEGPARDPPPRSTTGDLGHWDALCGRLRASS